MLRQHENPDSFKAGVLSIVVHVLLLGALLVSFNWKTTHPVSVAEVELWDSIPSPATKIKPQPIVTPKPIDKPKPVIKEQVKPEPVIVPKPDPVDIVIKKKPAEKTVKPERHGG